jgi:pyruvate kinase
VSDIAIAVREGADAVMLSGAARLASHALLLHCCCALL